MRLLLSAAQRGRVRWLLLLLLLSPCSAVTHYTITLADPARHLVEIQILLPAGPAARQLQLPVWNALYQIRDFAQYINWVRAKDRAGRSLEVVKLNKSRWRVAGTEAGAVIEYQMFVDSPGPFGAQLNLRHAFFNLAQLLMYTDDSRAEPVSVRFARVPANWRIATPLRSGADDFAAENYDRAVDSPVEIGDFHESDFDEGGGHYRVIIDAEPADFDAAQITAMLRKIVVAATSWMNDRPFDNYMFLYHFPRGPAGGGMEHAYSTAIAVNAEVLGKSPEILASVTAHEFFHLWNVKRIRPNTLEPVDFTKENYTRALWFSEGCTSTAADMIQLRAGLLDEHHLEEDLAADIGELQRRPAHLSQSAEESSLDAWLEGDTYYRRPQRSVSYYNKGELLGIALDLAVRDASHGQASLREVFRWMNQNYAKQQRFFPDSDGVRRAAEAVSHSDLGWFFTKYVAGTEEIPWNDFFRVVGLRLVSTMISVTDPGFMASRNFDGPMTVEAVTEASDAELAGLQTGDTILEIDGLLPGQELSETTARMSAGDTITLKIRSRRGVERELKWKVSAHKEVSYEVTDVENVTADQRAARAAWLKGEPQDPAQTN